MIHGTAEQVAHAFTEAALGHYKQDGYVVPMLALISDEVRVYSMLAANDDIPMSGGRVLGALGALADPRFAVFVSETWMKSFSPENAPDPDNFPHGELGRMHDTGDPEVHTAVLVYVLDCEDHDRSHCLITVDRDGHLEETMDEPGLGYGRVSDILVSAYAHTRLDKPPPEFTLNFIAAALQAIGLTTVTLVEMADEGAADVG